MLEGNMEQVLLFTERGELVVTAKILPYQIPPAAVGWGQRLFIRREDGHYYEGFVAFTVGTVEQADNPKPGEPQTCPRRAEGLAFGSDGADRWTLENWRFTDPEEARKSNVAESERKNLEAAAKGYKSTSYSNDRYWLWPGPGPMPRTCSYCGGVHPEDALKLKKEFKFEIGSTTKRYKVYIEPPGYGIEQLNSLTNMQAGVDPVEAFIKNKVRAIYPPLKAYSPHFTTEQWQELLR
jgi:hypothetical protein